MTQPTARLIAFDDGRTIWVKTDGTAVWVDFKVIGELTADEVKMFVDKDKGERR